MKNKVKTAVKIATTAGKNAADTYMAKNDINHGWCGFAHASTYKVTSPEVQLLLKMGVARGPYDGCVLVSLDGGWPISQSLKYKEVIYEAVSEVLTKELGVQFYLHSKDD